MIFFVPELFTDVFCFLPVCRFCFSLKPLPSFVITQNIVEVVENEDLYKQELLFEVLETFEHFSMHGTLIDYPKGAKNSAFSVILGGLYGHVIPL
jgi:hypothetical protein